MGLGLGGALWGLGGLVRGESRWCLLKCSGDDSDSELEEELELEG